MKLRMGAVVAGAATLCIASVGVRAEEPPYDPAFDVQLFEYAIGPRTFMTVSNTDQASQGGLTFDFVLTFLTDPFTVYNVDQMDDVIIGSRTEVIKSMVAGDLMAAYGLTDKLQLGAALPIIFSMAGDGLTPADGGKDPAGLQASGLGDLRVELKSQLWRKNRMAVAGAIGLTLPSSVGTEGGSFLGDDLPSLRGRVAGQWTNADGKLSLGANLGFIGRKPRDVYASEIGQQMTYGLAASMKVTERFSMIAETFGRSGFASFDVDESPLEAIGGVRVAATSAISVLAGGGAGLVRGIGSPGLRMFVSLGWAPDYRDDDGDGVANYNDRCPLAAEDFDDFEDGDGCPELDNDGDRREDAEDRCPNVPEDIDGFEDEDGCPDTDNDGDGFADLDDRCPMEKEDGVAPHTTDGCPASRRDSDGDNVSDDVDACPEDPEDADDFEDWDGCPDPDNDGDGISDEADSCPMCAEDMDGFEDSDGCPELDNDGDGILDADDKCPMAAETLNGRDDADGCPEGSGAPAVAMDGNKVSFNEEVKFDRSGGINRRSEWIVQEAARVMLRERDVVKWMIVVAAPTEARAQSQAEAIKTRLSAAGVDPDSIDVLARGSNAAQFGIVARERSDEPREAAPMTCPAGTEVTPRPQPAPAAPAAVPDAPKAPTAAAAPVAARAAPAAPVTSPVAPKELPSDFAKLNGTSASVGFKRDHASFAGGATAALDSLAALLVKNPTVAITITTHTDGRKGVEKSLKITAEQAEAAMAYLVSKGVAADRITAQGKGMNEPLGNNKTSAGRDENRRVVITFSVRP